MPEDVDILVTHMAPSRIAISMAGGMKVAAGGEARKAEVACVWVLSWGKGC